MEDLSLSRTVAGVEECFGIKWIGVSKESRHPGQPKQEVRSFPARVVNIDQFLQPNFCMLAKAV